MTKKTFLFFSLILGICVAGCHKNEPAFSATNLRCEFLSNPLGIDITTPRLSWEITVPGRGVMQTAYQIMVASSPENLKKGNYDLWNSGKIMSDSTVDVKYAGDSLHSGTDCYWKVNVWLNDRKDSLVSDIAHWSMGLLHSADWSAEWTGLDSSFAWEDPHAVHTRLSARYFRKGFHVDKKIKKAVVYISGLGIYQLYIDGQKIGKEELSPDPTQYNDRVFYNTFDVTKDIQEGKNVIGAILGNGRFFTMRWGKSDIPPIMNFGYPKMLLQMNITYDDGSVQKVVSDSTWKVTAHGPVVANNEYDGEDYNALLEMPGWSKPGFNDSNWLQAQHVAAPCDTVEAQMDPLIIVMDSLKPKSITKMSDGSYMVDMGQNMVGWARINIPDGKSGDTVTMRFAERLNPDSTLYTANLRSAEATDHYIMKNGNQEWEPHFTYHGFRYIEVSGYPGKLTPSDIQGRVVYDNLPTTGHFNTSNKVVNQIYHNAYWGIRSNYRGMPTDCPQRDERMGWLGDRAVGSYGESFIFDNNTLYAKWLQDIEDAQLPDGSIPDVAPTYWKVYSDNMTWPGAYVIIANMLYHQFDNIKPIDRHYESMKLWLSYMKDKYMQHYILNKDTYGDWCMPPENPEQIHSTDSTRITAGAYLGTVTYYRMLSLMEHFADLLHKPDDKKAFEMLGDSIKLAFNKKYLNNATGAYSNNTATADVLALAYDLVPDSLRDKTFQQVVNTTMDKFHGHISTGLVGAQQLMRTLTRFGRPDLAFRLDTNTTYPSWGYMAKEGATTIWELWNGNTADPAMNSGNHVMLLGDLVVWMYEDLGGIKSDPDQAGFKKIIMKPYPVEGLDFVNASYHSVHGPIKSDWKVKDKDFNWNITVPANTTAEIYIPAKSEDDITESGKKAGEAEDVRFVKMDGSRAVFEIGSGDYHFVSKGFE
jgi:alpha-L-rhamnosidase